MRKNITALILVLPLLFVFVVFSAVNAASLDVQISANGIEILERYPGDTISIDLADYETPYEITPSVQPANASDRTFDYRFDAIEGNDQQAEIEVTDGKIYPKSVGVTRVVAVSHDGGFEDGITVIVGSSKPYAFDWFLYAAEDAGRENNLLTEDGDGYQAQVGTGRYTYAAKLSPNGYLRPEIGAATSGFVDVDRATGTLLLPFSGTTEFTVRLEDGAFGPIEKQVKIEVARPAGTLTVNGGTQNKIVIGEDETEAFFYVEADTMPEVTCADSEDVGADIKPVDGVANGYAVTLTLPADGQDYSVDIRAGEDERTLMVCREGFTFHIDTDLPAQTESGKINVLKDTPISFFAVPDGVSARGITFKWDVINADDDLAIRREFDPEGEDGGAVCTVTAVERTGFILVVGAYNGNVQDDTTLIDEQEIEVEVVNRVTAVQFGNNTSVGLARKLAVAGWRYGADGQKIANRYALDMLTFSVADRIDGAEDLDFASSDPAIADVVRDDTDKNAVVEDGSAFLDVRGKGTVTITASWKANEDYGENITASITLLVDNDAVEVRTSTQLFNETDMGSPIVLGGDILLGTLDDNVTPLPIGERKNMLHTMRSTYNVEYYKNIGAAAQANVNYVIEFKNDVYGNGYTINAELFAHAQDNTGTPQIFMGPLFFVNLGGIASVAGQDNISFLARTDGVTIYNTVLLGCSDSSLESQNGSYDLTRLNNVGTVLEINADVNVLNCRIRNGRNVVRAYGGNRSGEKYFIDSLSENNGCDEERITVHIEGCILSQGREFLLKTGANRALRAGAALGREPVLVDRNGKAYDTQTNNYLDDDYFYTMYVMTDVTLADSVLERSGLFCVGVESNFAGEVLSPGSRYSETFGDWIGTGGTSFATVLRLEGDVRLYDWKELALVDSSTLIDSTSSQIKLDIAGMLTYMRTKDPARFGTIIEQSGNKEYVHGGIALYGGGRNYAQVSLGGINQERSDLHEYRINISEISDAEGDMGGIGRLLPLAAGSQDFRFYMYGNDSSNTYESQLAEISEGKNGVVPQFDFH